MIKRLLIVLCLLAVTQIGYSQSVPTQSPELAENVNFRNLTPAMTGGRISKVVKDYSDPSTWYVGVASGGVWKTTNNGTTWKPIFQQQGSFSIGTIAIDPKDPNVIWVGTGENNAQRSVSFGDGVYKSVDGGKTWENVGLENSNHIGKIVINPNNPDEVFVAAQGPLWSAGGHRGLYKTTDGGETWNRDLYVSDNTGISDIVMDPSNSDILYAASYQRRRHFGILVAGGSEGAIFKSTDGGQNWEQLKRGLPTAVNVGRIGLAISPQKPDVVYAIIKAEGDSEGFYRSSNRGETWAKKSNQMVIDPQYYMELFPSPHKFDKVYAVDVWTSVTTDGGSTWDTVPSENMHVDNHDILFDSDDPNYMMMSNDGGIYQTWDNADTWKFADNLPITQFYRVGIDNAQPFYHVYGGTQDNGTLGAPNQTINQQGIVNGDWFVTKGGDGFQVRVDPTNPNIVYNMSQYGVLARYDKSSGQQINIQPRPAEGQSSLRWHWNAPLEISPHNSNRLYYAANKLFKSEDRGSSWTAVSGDLTKQIDRNAMEVMGRVWSPDAISKNVFTSPLSTIVALDESPLQEGLIYVGTDDGLIQVSENGGQSWRKVNDFPGVPKQSYTSDVFASPVNEDQVFAVFNNHKYGDYKPYVLVSNDRGKTWRSISSDLSDDEFGWSIYQDHENPNMLFLGTEFGLQYSLNGGQSWTEFEDLPTIPVRDIEIQKREDDLVLATFGRGFYILDNYAFMRDLTKQTVAKQAHIFPVKDALQYVRASRHSDTRGDDYYSSSNPPYGALITYYLKNDIPSLKEQRKQREDQKIEAGETVKYPSWEELEREDRHGQPFVLLTIEDKQGDVVTRIKKPANGGINRVSWDLRSTPVGSGSPRPMVPPGQYKVSLTKVVNGEWTPIGNSQAITVRALDNVTLPAKDRDRLATFETQAVVLNARINMAEEDIEQAVGKIEEIKQAVVNTADDNEAFDTAEQLRITLLDLKETLVGDVTKTSRFEYGSPGIKDRSNFAMGSIWSSTSAATGTQKENYRIAKREFKQFSARYETAQRKLDKLTQRLAEQGIYIE